MLPGGSAPSAIYQALSAAAGAGEAVVLATVIAARGSAPRHVGAKLVWYADGRQIGSVGGGEMEARVLVVARDVLASGVAQRVTYRLVEPQAGDPGVCGGEMEVFVEPIVPAPVMVVLGCGHVGRAVAHLARWAGFRVWVADDRAELCTPEAVPGAERYWAGPLAPYLAEVTLGPQTAVVAVTRAYKYDVAALPLLLAMPLGYLGVMGSRRRWETTRAALLAQGVSAEALGRVRAPIGLALGAETPEEIAVSIVGEVIAVRRNRPAPPA